MCRAAVRQALQKTDGVLGLDTDASGFAVIYDGSKVTPEELIQVVSRTGYEATLRAPPHRR